MWKTFFKEIISLKLYVSCGRNIAILVDIQSRNFNRHENQFKPDSRHEVINFILAVLFWSSFS